MNNPAYETWPGIGIWQEDADGGLGASCNSCEYKLPILSLFCESQQWVNLDAGPQYVQAFPPFCTTDGIHSWITTCTSSLTYTEYNSIDCTGSVITADSFSFPLGGWSATFLS